MMATISQFIVLTQTLNKPTEAVHGGNTDNLCVMAGPTKCPLLVGTILDTEGLHVMADPTKWILVLVV